MIYCYKCGFKNADDAQYCSKCGTLISGPRKFDDNVKEFSDDMAKLGKDMGEKAAKLGKKVAEEAKSIAEGVSKRINPKPLACPKCATRIYETDVFCYACGEKSS
jgi:uncharacterized membrane protein YvbJ